MLDVDNFLSQGSFFEKFMKDYNFLQIKGSSQIDEQNFINHLVLEIFFGEKVQPDTRDGHHCNFAR